MVTLLLCTSYLPIFPSKYHSLFSGVFVRVVCEFTSGIHHRCSCVGKILTSQFSRPRRGLFEQCTVRLKRSASVEKECIRKKEKPVCVVYFELIEIPSHVCVGMMYVVCTTIHIFKKIEGEHGMRGRASPEPLLLLRAIHVKPNNQEPDRNTL